MVLAIEKVLGCHARSGTNQLHNVFGWYYFYLLLTFGHCVLEPRYRSAHVGIDELTDHGRIQITCLDHKLERHRVCVDKLIVET